MLSRLDRALRQLVRTARSELGRTHRVILPSSDFPLASPPIFVIGVHRSGTTLVRLILDSHSRIACPPESFFLRPIQSLLSDRKAMEGLQAMGFEREHVAARMRVHVAYFFEAYARLHGKVRWADKTPSYVDCLDLIETLFGPACQYVLVYRHGLDAACSMARIPDIHDLDVHLPACGGDRFAAAARHWSTQCQKMLEFSTSHADRCHVIRYEDLVREPESEVRRLLDFLAEPWEPGTLRFFESRHDSWPSLEDVKAMRSRGFTPNVGRHRDEPPSVIERMRREAEPMLRTLGYEAPSSGGKG